MDAKLSYSEPILQRTWSDSELAVIDAWFSWKNLQPGATLVNHGLKFDLDYAVALRQEQLRRRPPELRS